MSTLPRTGFKTASGYNRLRSPWLCVVGEKGSRRTSVRLRAFSTSGLARDPLARSRHETGFGTTSSRWVGVGVTGARKARDLERVWFGRRSIRLRCAALGMTGRRGCAALRMTGRSGVLRSGRQGQVGVGRMESRSMGARGGWVRWLGGRVWLWFGGGGIG